MRRATLCLLIAGLVLAGCGDDDARIPLETSVQPTKKAIERKSYAESDLVGKYWAVIRADASKADQRKLLDVTKGWHIEFDGKDAFSLHFVAPMEGTYSVDGDTLTLTVLTYDGMSLRELQKLSEGKPKNERPNIEEMKTLEFRVLDGGKNLLMMKGQAIEPGLLVFERRA